MKARKRKSKVSEDLLEIDQKHQLFGSNMDLDINESDDGLSSTLLENGERLSQIRNTTVSNDF